MYALHLCLLGSSSSALVNTATDLSIELKVSECMRRTIQLRPQDFFDIGCNKGYEVALVMELFAPWTNVTTANVRAEQENRDCGRCGDCKRPRQRVKAKRSADTSSIEVHCYEPSPTSYGRLVKIRDALLPEKPGKQTAAWHTHNKVLSNKVGWEKFTANCSSEQCAIGATGVDIESTTIDNEMLRLGIPYADIMKIDTEGYDPAVLEGALHALEEQRIGILEFEYHEKGLWASTTLESIVERLEHYGLVCYFAAGDQYYRLTRCWVSGFEFKKWSNVVCFSERHFMFPEIEFLSVLGAMAREKAKNLSTLARG